MANEAEATRAEEIIQSMRQALGSRPHAEWEWAARQDPDFAQLWAAFSNYMWSEQTPRALSAKFRELIAIVVLAMRGFHWTLVPHMRRAMRLGASKQEILEALETAVIPGGAPVMHLGLYALMELEKEERSAKG